MRPYRFHAPAPSPLISLSRPCRGGAAGVRPGPPPGRCIVSEFVAVDLVQRFAPGPAAPPPHCGCRPAAVRRDPNRRPCCRPAASASRRCPAPPASGRAAGRPARMRAASSCRLAESCCFEASVGAASVPARCGFVSRFRRVRQVLDLPGHRLQVALDDAGRRGRHRSGGPGAPCWRSSRRPGWSSPASRSRSTALLLLLDHLLDALVILLGLGQLGRAGPGRGCRRCCTSRGTATR